MTAPSRDLEFEDVDGACEGTAAWPEHFEDLDDTVADAGDQQRWKRLVPRLALAAGTVAALLALAVGALLVRSPLRMLVGRGPQPTASAVPGRSTTATPSPVPSATAVPTLAARRVIVSGPETYVDPALPYKAAYTIGLRVVESASVTVECPECLTRRDSGAHTVVDGGEVVDQVAVAPGSGDVRLTLLVDGARCTSWVLAPGAEETIFSAACSP